MDGCFALALLQPDIIYRLVKNSLLVELHSLYNERRTTSAGLIYGIFSATTSRFALKQVEGVGKIRSDFSELCEHLCDLVLFRSESFEQERK